MTSSSIVDHCLALAVVTAGILSGCRGPLQAGPAFCARYPPTPGPGQWQSSRVSYGPDGKLVYAADAERNRIPDFSYAGYRYGEVELPFVPVVARLTPAAGDQTARIQAALDQIGARPADRRGIRGALLLAPGTYDVQGILWVRHSGVVLRGSGRQSTGTVLRILGDEPHQRTGVILGRLNPKMHGPTNHLGWTEVAPRADITTPFVPVGSMSFEVASTAGFTAGDEVAIRHPSPLAWIEAVGCGGVPTAGCWSPGKFDIVYYRRIARLSGSTVTLDAPVYNALDRGLVQPYLARLATNHISESGIEDLRVDIQTAGGADEDHAWNAIGVYGAHDSWVRGVSTLHFGYAGVRVASSVRVTIEDAEAIDPVGIRTGARFYNFSADRGAQLVLFKRCHVTQARHGFVSNGGTEASGLVWYRCTADGSFDIEGGHKEWTQGVLYDNVVEAGQGTVKLINRGDWGGGHGWSAANSVSWRFNKASQIMKPPTAQNYGVTDIGSFDTNYRWPGGPGVMEVKGGQLVPQSLYEAQLCERLRARL